jgi:hypothetical protein
LPCSRLCVDGLSLGLWVCGHRLEDVDPSVGRRRPQIDGADAVGAEMHAEHAVLGGVTQHDRLAAERPAEPQAAVLERNPAVAIGDADEIVAIMLDRRQRLRKRSSARMVALAGLGEIEGLVRAMVIVEMAPALEGTLARSEIGEMVSGAPRP